MVVYQKSALNVMIPGWCGVVWDGADLYDFDYNNHHMIGSFSHILEHA